MRRPLLEITFFFILDFPFCLINMPVFSYANSTLFGYYFHALEGNDWEHKAYTLCNMFLNVFSHLNF